MIGEYNMIQATIVKEDADVFLAFQKHREKFLVLLEAGVFDLQGGQAEVNIINGQIQTVHIHNLTYKRTSNTQKGAIY